MQVKCLTLCTPLAFWLGNKVRHWNYADEYILIGLSDLIGFGYDQMDLGVGERDLYFVVNILSSLQGFRWMIQGPRGFLLNIHAQLCDKSRSLDFILILCPYFVCEQLGSDKTESEHRHVSVLAARKCYDCIYMI